MMKFQNKHTAFVLSLFDTGLDAVRNLGRAGIPVIGMDFDLRTPGFKSRYCAAKACPCPIDQPEELLSFLLREGEKLSLPGILFPASDKFVSFVSRFRQQLSKYFRFILPSDEIVEAILDKSRQYELATRLGIDLPCSFYPGNNEEVTDLKDKVSYPAFIKPCHTHLWIDHFSDKGFEVHSPDELTEKLESIMQKGLRVVVQEVIPGPASNNYEVSLYVNHYHEVLGIFVVRKWRQYPPRFGVGTLVESVNYPHLVSEALKFVRSTGFVGFANIEFKIDKRDQKPKFIEINARLWQQHALAKVCGINFPLLQYLDLTDQTVHARYKYTEGVKWMNPVSDFQSFLYHFGRKNLSPKDWLLSLKRARSFGVFAKDDLLPGLHEVEYGLKVLKMPLYMLRHRNDL